MTDTLARAFAGDIEVRASGEGRTIAGIFVPWERSASVSDGGPVYREMFQRGSLSKTIAERGSRVKFLSQHSSRTNPLGRATLLREDAAGAYGEFVVSKTQAGDEALELVRDGALDSFSVGFTPVKHERRDGAFGASDHSITLARRKSSGLNATFWRRARVRWITSFGFPKTTSKPSTIPRGTSVATAATLSTSTPASATAMGVA